MAGTGQRLRSRDARDGSIEIEPSMGSAQPVGFGHDGGQLCKLGIGELEGRGADVVFQVLDGRCSRNEQGDRRAAQHPGQRDDCRETLRAAAIFSTTSLALRPCAIGLQGMKAMPLAWQ